MKFNNLQNTFIGGEWSKQMKVRTDLAQYYQACSELKNFIPRSQGGAWRRPGTIRYRIQSAAHDTDFQQATENNVQLIPWNLSDGTRYILILNKGTPADWSLINITTTTITEERLAAISSELNSTWTSDEVATQKWVQIGDFLVFGSKDGLTPPGILSIAPSDYSFGGAPGNEGLPVFEIFARFEAYPERKGTDGIYQVLGYMPHRDINAGGIGPTMTIAVGSPSLGLVPATATTSLDFFKSGHETLAIATTEFGHEWGAFRLGTGGTGTYFLPLKIVSATMATGYIGVSPNPSLPAASAVSGTFGADYLKSWSEPSWSPVHGYPRMVTTFQGRLYFGGTLTEPDTIWGSRIGNITDFELRPLEHNPYFDTYTDDNSRPFSFAASNNEACVLKDMSAGRTLFINTSRGEVIVRAKSGAVGPLDIDMLSPSSLGSDGAKASRADNFLTFIQKGGRRLQDMSFNLLQDEYQLSDLGFTSQHLTIDEENIVYPDNGEDPIVEIVGQDGGLESYMWCRTREGRLLCITLNRNQSIVAWSQVILGGTSQNKTYPIVKAMCSAETAIDAEGRYLNILWLVVVRRIDGANVAFLERFDQPYEVHTFNHQTMTAPFFMDLKTKIDMGSSVTAVTGATHLIGQSVQVISNGRYIGEYTVNGSGNITISSLYAGRYFVYGLKYESSLQTMPIQIGAQLPGSSNKRIKRIHEAFLEFHNTYGGQYGYDEDQMYDIDFKDPNANMNAQIEFQTGTKRLELPTDYDRDAQYIIKQDKPWPCNILAITSCGVTYD